MAKQKCFFIIEEAKKKKKKKIKFFPRNRESIVILFCFNIISVQNDAI